MDVICNQDGFKHIGFKILKNLEFEDLLNCRRVNHSWQKLSEDPRFWFKRILKKFEKQNLSQYQVTKLQMIKEAWYQLIDMIAEKDELLQCLMKLNRKIPKIGLVHPLLAASKIGKLKLVKFIYENVRGPHRRPRRKSDYNSYSLCTPSNGFTIMHALAKYGHLNLIAFFARKRICDTPDTGDINNWTPIHIAVHHDRTEVVRALLTLTNAPNTASRKGKVFYKSLKLIFPPMTLLSFFSVELFSLKNYFSRPLLCYHFFRLRDFP